MAYFFEEPSHTFDEYLLIPGYTGPDCTPANVCLQTPVVRYNKKKGEPCPLTMNIPMTSAVMQSVSNDTLAVALAKEGGISFIYGSQSIEDQAAMVARVKAYKAGFVTSDTNIRPDQTLQELVNAIEITGHSTVAVTEDGTANGKLLGIITERDFRIGHCEMSEKVSNYMTPLASLVKGEEGITLEQANDIIWEKKVNQLPIIDKNGNLKYMVFRKDAASHEEHPNELLDGKKRYIVGAGINTRDYMERVPALLEAGVDVMTLDSSEGFTEWQRRALQDIHAKWPQAKVGAGNVVDAEGFNFLAEAGADFVKIGIGGGSICITREQKGIGRGQATATIEVAKARDEYYKETGKMLINTPAQYKEEYPYLREVDSLALANVQLNLQEAYKRFFTVKGTGHPKFKSKKHEKFSYTTNNQNGTVRIDAEKEYIRLPKTGNVKAVIHRLPAEDKKIKAATVSMTKDGKYFCSVLFEYDRDIQAVISPETNAVGLDYKSDGLYADSEGNTCGSPKFFRKGQKRLTRAQRKLRHKIPGSSNYIKAKMKIAKEHRHTANQRKDFLHKASTAIANRYDMVCVENLDMRAMSNKGFGNGKATLDNGYGLFLNLLQNA